MNLRTVITLLRLPNLVIMIFTMYSFRHFVIIPILKFSGSNTSIPHLVFFLIVLSVVLIAAGGYIINDYYDVITDTINKPERMVVGREIGSEKAYNLFHIFSFTGVVLAFTLHFYAGIRFIGFIHLGCALMLWAYAAYLKKLMLAGNILIGLMSSLTILITAFYDAPAWNAEPILYLAIGYAVFAFLLSLVRELIKDLEDLKGDLAAGCRTFPVVAGPRISKFAVYFLILIIMFLLGVIQRQQVLADEYVSMAFIGLFIQIPLALLFYAVLKSSTAKDLHKCSTLSKVIMLTGILSMFIFFLGFR